MVKTTLLLGAAIAVAIGSGPVMAQSYSPAYAPASGPDCAHCVQVPVRDTAGYAGYSGSSYESRSRETLAGGPAVYEQRSMETRSSESRSYEDQRSIQSDYYAAERREARIHHTTDAAGYLSWVGKTSDMALGQDGSRYGPPPAYGHREEAVGGSGVGGPGCPSVHGERVVSCRYIPFTPVEQSISISDEDFAYEGGAGPAFIGGGEGGGGGGGGSSMGFGGGFASANSSSSASASAVVSSNVSVNISGHMGGYGHGYGGGGYHGGGHGGGSWGGGMGGGHMKSGCGCKK